MAMATYGGRILAIMQFPARICTIIYLGMIYVPGWFAVSCDLWWFSHLDPHNPMATLIAPAWLGEWFRLTQMYNFYHNVNVPVLFLIHNLEPTNLHKSTVHSACLIIWYNHFIIIFLVILVQLRSQRPLGGRSLAVSMLTKCNFAWLKYCRTTYLPTLSSKIPFSI